jgi:hypothetical protein
LVRVLAAAGAGFLLAVLWFDLMFDIQVLRRRGDLPESVLASIAAYYRRVTTEARPMNRLVAVAMLTTIVAIVAELSRGDAPRWVGAASLFATLVAVGLATVRTVPRAVRLGSRSDPIAVQSELARSVCRDHITCIVLIATVLVLQIAA